MSEYCTQGLKELCKINPDTLPDSTDPRCEFRYIDLSSIQDQKANLTIAPEKFALLPSRARRKVRCNDVLLGTVRPNLKNFAIIESQDNDLVCSTGFAVLRSIEGVSDPRYIFHAINSEIIGRQLNALVTGSNYPAVNATQVGELLLPVPPLPEQKKIAKILSGIDKILSSQQSNICSLQVLRKALVSRYIENSENSAEESKLGDLLLSIDSGWSPDCLKRAPANENEWSVLKTTSVTWKGFDQHERKALPGNLMPRPELVVEEGDILITRAGPTERTGVVAYAAKKAPNTMISDKIIRLRCDSKLIDSLFLAIFLGTDFSQRQMLKGKVGMALSQTNISQQLLKDMTIRFPSLQEQKRVSEIVSELQKEINSIQRYVENIENLKQAVSSDLLSGRKRGSI